MKKHDAYRPAYEVAELFGKPALFTEERIDRDGVPGNLYMYETRSAEGFGDPLMLEPFVMVNFAGTVITTEPLDFGGEKFLSLGECGSDDYALNFVGEEMNMQEWLAQYAPVNSLEDETANKPKMDETLKKLLLFGLREAGYHNAVVDTERGEITPIPEYPSLKMTQGCVMFDSDAEGGARDLAHGRIGSIYNDAKRLWIEWRQARPMPENCPQTYRILAENGDTVLAARPDQSNGLYFTTWEYDYERTGVHGGNYTTSYAAAKRDFAVRSGLVTEDELFSIAETLLMHKALRLFQAEYAQLEIAQERTLDAICEKLEQTCPELEGMDYQFEEKMEMEAREEAFNRIAPEMQM